MNNRPPRSGYILLISIVVIGAIASTILSTMLLLGISANQLSLSVQQSKQALAAAQACSEYALLKLRTIPAYSGNETLSIDGSGTSCQLLTIGGTGNTNRSICIQGVSASVTRRLEISVSRILPKTLIASWQEVGSFTLCQ
jgi:hypothetical protein